MPILGINPTGEYARETTKNDQFGKYLKPVNR